MLPLRWKLVSLYAGILLLVLAAFSVALVVRLRQASAEAADTECQTRARAVAAVLERDGAGWTLDKEAGIEDEFAADRGLYFLVLDERGAAVLASPLARPLGLAAADVGAPRELNAGGARYREVTVPVKKPPDEDDKTAGAELRIVCGKDMKQADFSLASLLGQLLVVGPLILIASLAGGFLLVSRALRPIDRMARTASAIGATDLSRRIEVEGADELARLARTLNETFDRLQESFERQTRFTADASHELRTPLSVVASNAELALNRPRSAEEYREIFVDIQEASQRMQAIVEGLLTLARADANGRPLARERVSLRALADEVVRLYRPLADERGVTLSIESTGDAVVTGDQERLKELVSNLLTNAIRYNRRGGKVLMRLSADDGIVRVSVDDTGIGIPAEHLPHIFERFYRVDEARPHEMGGSGLGLAIAKWIVDAHSGTIQVSSQPGVGTKFLVSLPA